MAPHETPEVMDKGQCAAYLGVGTTTIERWRDNEGLPFVKIGNVARYRRAAVDEWLAARETSKTVTPSTTVAVRRRPRRHP